MDRTIKIVEGEDVYEFDEEKHVHKLNGKVLTGVTSLLDKTLSKPALLPWAVKMFYEYITKTCPVRNTNGYDFYEVTEPDLLEGKKAHTKKKEDAGDWGTRVHTACETWAKTGVVDETDDIYPSVKNFIDYIQNNGFKVLDVERPVWSKKWWIGGIFDLVLEKDGKVYIADIKTSSGIYDSHFIQMGAYYKCLVENDWVKRYGVDHFEGAIVINLKKDHTIATCRSTALDAMVESYEGIVSIYRNRALLETITKAVKYGSQF